MKQVHSHRPLVPTPGGPHTHAAGMPRQERGADRRDEGPSSANIRYPVNGFVEDQRQMLSATTPRATDVRPTLRLMDGRWIAVHPTIRFKLDVPALREQFSSKYGHRIEPAYRSRFELVLRFLADWEVEVVKSGLAYGRAPMAVREEFVDYLLKYRLSTRQREIPEAALRLFLDDWGHRWF